MRYTHKKSNKQILKYPDKFTSSTMMFLLHKTTKKGNWKDN